MHLRITFCDARSFTDQPAGSNSTEQLLSEVNWKLLSEVNWRTEIRLLISLGETRTLLREMPGNRHGTSSRDRK